MGVLRRSAPLILQTLYGLISNMSLPLFRYFWFNIFFLSFILSSFYLWKFRNRELKKKQLYIFFFSGIISHYKKHYIFFLVQCVLYSLVKGSTAEAYPRT